MFIPVGINDELTLRIPQFFCCNCGSAEEVSSASTPLTVVRYGMPGGTPQTIRLDLPYCNRCFRTAQRRPVGTVKKLLVAAIMALTVGLLALLVPTTRLPDVIGHNIFYLSAALALVLVFGLYSLQKPKGRQTSYYQPVRLEKIDKKPSGPVTGLTLAFAHARYAQMFANANREAIDRAALRVVALRRTDRR